MSSTIYLVESRYYHLNIVPSWLEVWSDGSGIYFSTDLSDVPADVSSFLIDGEISESLVQKYLLDNGYEGISESWSTSIAFQSQSAAELYAKTFALSYSAGCRIRPTTLIDISDQQKQ